MQTGPLKLGCRAALFGGDIAPPGAVRFDRYLHEQNRTPHTQPGRRVVDLAELTCDVPRDASEPSPPPAPCATPAPLGLLPRLGEVLPAAPHPVARTTTEVRFLQSTPVTGRLVDLMA